MTPEALDHAISRIDALETELRVLRDIEAIRTLRARYAEACDNGYDADAMSELFAPDGVLSFTHDRGTHRGREEIHAFMTEIGKQIVWALHFMISPVVTVRSPTEATGTWYLLEFATMIGRGNSDEHEAVVISGRYEDQYVKVGCEWKFQHVTLDVSQRSNLAEGWVKQPFRKAEASAGHLITTNVASNGPAVERSS